MLMQTVWNRPLQQKLEFADGRQRICDMLIIVILWFFCIYCLIFRFVRSIGELSKDLNWMLRVFLKFKILNAGFCHRKLFAIMTGATFSKLIFEFRKCIFIRIVIYIIFIRCFSWIFAHYGLKTQMHVWFEE